jgi:hypothetical protein
MGWLRRDQGQAGLEYLLVVGTMVVALTIALTYGFNALLPQVVGFICPSVDTAAIPAATIGSCLGP